MTHNVIEHDNGWEIEDAVGNLVLSSTSIDYSEAYRIASLLDAGKTLAEVM